MGSTKINFGALLGMVEEWKDAGYRSVVLVGPRDDKFCKKISSRVRRRVDVHYLYEDYPVNGSSALENLRKTYPVLDARDSKLTSSVPNISCQED